MYWLENAGSWNTRLKQNKLSSSKVNNFFKSCKRIIMKELLSKKKKKSLLSCAKSNNKAILRGNARVQNDSGCTSLGCSAQICSTFTFTTWQAGWLGSLSPVLCESVGIQVTAYPEGHWSVISFQIHPASGLPLIRRKKKKINWKGKLFFSWENGVLQYFFSINLLCISICTSDWVQNVWPTWNCARFALNGIFFNIYCCCY